MTRPLCFGGRTFGILAVSYRLQVCRLQNSPELPVVAVVGGYGGAPPLCFFETNYGGRCVLKVDAQEGPPRDPCNNSPVTPPPFSSPSHAPPLLSSDEHPGMWGWRWGGSAALSSERREPRSEWHGLQGKCRQRGKKITEADLRDANIHLSPGRPDVIYT